MDVSILIGVVTLLFENASSSRRFTIAFVGDGLEVEAIVESLAIARTTSRSLGAFEEFAVAWVPEYRSDRHIRKNQRHIPLLPEKLTMERSFEPVRRSFAAVLDIPGGFSVLHPSMDMLTMVDSSWTSFLG